MANRYRILILLLLFSTNVAANQNSLRFGVFPYLTPTRIDTVYSPFIAHISKQTNIPLRLSTTSTHQLFLKRLKEGYYDIALIQPFWYPVAVDQAGYVPLLRTEEHFSSRLVVTQNSPYHSVKDLIGKKIATPPPHAPVISLLRQQLQKKGYHPDKSFTFISHRSADSCLQQILIGKAAACIASPYAKSAFENEMNITLRSVFNSDSIPGITLIGHSRIDSSLTKSMSQKILQFSKTREGKEALDSIFSQGFTTLQDKDYDIIRKLLQQKKH